MAAKPLALLALAAGCSVVDPFEGYAGGKPTSDGSFEARCDAPGVIRCYGFDEPSELASYYQPSASGSAEIDPVMKTSGAGALRLRISENPSPESLAGLFGINFADDWSVAIVPGEQVFVQWRQRFSQSLLDTRWSGGGMRQAAITVGDRLGNSAGVKASPGVTMGNFYYRGMPQLGSTAGVPFQPDVPGEPCSFLQNASGCNGCQPFEPPLCVLYVADEWMTFQIGITLAPPGQNDRIEAWVGRQGEPARKIMDVEHALDDAGEKSLGKVWFHVSDTTLDGWPGIAADTFIDELVISRAPIADP